MSVVDYVWIGGRGELRSKTRVIYAQVIDVSSIPDWDYDGSSTEQATGENSEIFIRPRRLFKCPFRKPNGYIVLCDTYTATGEPALCNNRAFAENIFKQYADKKPWYGLEQEYFMIDPSTDHPLGFTGVQQGQYYCSVGSSNAFGRSISDSHLEACLYAGIHLSGTNAEVAPGQWEFQVGPVEGIDAADQLWIARYILERISEVAGVKISYDPKPFEEFNGSGCHTNFSTEETRAEGGYDVIIYHMEKLKNTHTLHMENYGPNNKARMTGKYETSSYDTFTYSIRGRHSSVRIPNVTALNQKGYYEDRRPSANCDPYLATCLILKTTS